MAVLNRNRKISKKELIKKMNTPGFHGVTVVIDYDWIKDSGKKKLIQRSGGIAPRMRNEGLLEFFLRSDGRLGTTPLYLYPSDLHSFAYNKILDAKTGKTIFHEDM